MLRVVWVFLLFFVSFSNSYADLTGTQHDLSGFGGSSCSYCHTVHNSVGGLGRPAYLGAALPDITAIYNSSPTLDHTITQSGVDNSDAPLCLSCHDAAFVEDKDTDIFNAINGTEADLTSDLSNDHPVGFIFDATLDEQIQAPPLDSSVHVTFGPAQNEMWCSTCHDPHGGVPGTPLLQTSNTGSALCLMCHLK